MNKDWSDDEDNNDDSNIYNSYSNSNKISWIYKDSILANKEHKINYKKLLQIYIMYDKILKWMFYLRQ